MQAPDYGAGVVLAGLLAAMQPFPGASVHVIVVDACAPLPMRDDFYIIGESLSAGNDCAICPADETQTRCTSRDLLWQEALGAVAGRTAALTRQPSGDSVPRFPDNPDRSCCGADGRQGERGELVIGHRQPSARDLVFR